MQRSIRGIPVHYRRLGAGRPIVMLHGLPSDHRLASHHLEPVFARRPGWRRFYPDLPGMGRTPADASIASTDDVLEVVLAFIDEVTDGGRFAIVGVSYGGYLARGILARRASRLDGVMLWTPAVHVRSAERRLPERRVFVRDAAAVADVSEDERPWLDISVVQTPATLRAFRATVAPGVALADTEAVRRIAARPVLSDASLAPEATFDGPSLVITGRQDHVCGYLEAWDLAAGLTRATYAVVDRAGHGVAEERPALFRALVADWLDRMDAAARDA